ncbi:mas-related G-protein coupled receptor member H-like [Ahaetulla prasina]|uniref:mas-related G-protein coupled receptor member H-like n=1 Tax=Ahaetulla prasina TaxID=499056 RepID=UPI002647B262|nr:mas-related G-protein coupled receptor member H-like [Ahaetulla prasina]
MNEEYLEYNATGVFDKYQRSKYFEIIIFIICSIGVPLNGIVIWLLGFQIKRNPFTIMILNLAIADFGFLAIWEIVCSCSFIQFIHFIPFGIPFIILNYLSYTLYINGLFLLTAISIDRCVAVLFPIWHRCSRPKHLSPVVCIPLNVYISLGGSLNSSVNPIIYYLVGRKKRAQTRESIKVVFERVFKEDEAPESTEKSTNRVSTPL